MTRKKPQPHQGRRKLRIGYHCSYISAITFDAIMGKVLRSHDRSKVIVFGYSPWPPRDYDYEGIFDCFRKTIGLTHEQYVQLIRDDRIDILVELSGFSDGNRFAAMAARCAPIQVAYVNHHATTAVPNVDFLITDHICSLAGDDRFFSETLYRLPGCFLCFNYEFEQSLSISLPPKQWNGFVTFGCFGHGAKLNTDLIGLWAMVLHRVPRSIMLICNTQLSAGGNKKFVIDRFRSFGITRDRLRLIEGTTDRRTVLGYLSEVDVSLDTFPYNGGNTIAESLWYGIPVVTLKGHRIASRYGASLVMAAGCPELVAESADQYVAIAEALSQDDEKLRGLRMNLREMMYDHGLSDAVRFVRKLEVAYDEMMARDHNVYASHG